jgi:hypothetical protein
MFKTIITHGGLAHTDDFLSCCVLLNKYPTIEVIKRVNVVNEEEFLNPTNIIVDIGGKYDNQNKFDHHQDSNLNCSLILILKDIFEFNVDFLMKIDEIKFLDLQDRFGIKKAQELMGINNPIINLTEYSILRWFSNQKEIYGQELQILKEIGKEFLNYLLSFQKEEQKILGSKIYKNKNGVILYNPTTTFNISIILKLLPDLIGVIHQSDRDPNLINIVQINNSPYFIPSKFITLEVSPIFTHKTGFLVVIKKEDLSKINLFNLLEGGE